MHREAAPPARRLRLGYRVMLLASRLRCAEPELRGLAALVRPGDRVLDVGAAHGMYMVPLAHLVGATGSVDSFEPHPRQQATLRRWRRLLGARHATVNDSAVGSARGQLTMRLPVLFGLPIYGRAHLTEGAAPVGARERVRHWPTPAVALDDWVAEHDVERVSFIKIDVEGFEPQVLQGAQATISRDLPSLLLEIEDRHLTRYGLDAERFLATIRQRWPEYRMHTWRDERWAPTPGMRAGVRNYLFATEAALTVR